jgi:hypothetical protein
MRLSIEKVHDIPLSEVSGLGRRRAPDGVQQVLAVGDRQFDVIIAHQDGEATWRFDRVSLESMLVGAHAADTPEWKSSEWEAADGDATGRLYLLQESPSRVYVINKDLDQIERVIDLKLDESQRRDLDWDVNANARAEGLVLLKNGHVLVAKEKEPPLVLEFSKHGDQAEGVQPGLLFDSLGEYPMPPDPTTTFELMATWSLDEASGITDISDMAEAPDGRLYLLSDESRCIARIKAATAGEPELSIEEIWELPEELKQPEGLVFMDGMVPLIAIDRDEQAKNLFVMQPLD